MEAPHYHAVKSESFSKTTKTDKKVLTGNTYDSFPRFSFPSAYQGIKES